MIESRHLDLHGYAVASFAFDIGYEVALERLSHQLESLPIPRLSRKRQTPTYLQFARQPQVLYLGTTNVLPGRVGQVSATVFDFGAVSLSYRWPLEEISQHSDLPSNSLSIEALPAFSRMLYEADLESTAWQDIKNLMEKLGNVIIRPELSDLVEDYYLFVIESLTDANSIQQVLTTNGGLLAQTLRADTITLSQDQRQEALSKAIRYYETDLVIVDWNSAIIIDTEHTDTVNVLEFLNVELLEARYIDAQLDKRLKHYENLVQNKLPQRWHQRIHWYIPFYEPYQPIIEELAELKIESALLAERVDNALKLIGDLYLARIHKAASERFYLHDWQMTISRKLDIIGNLYQLLTDRGSTAQAQTLELIIILLIFIEIVLGWFKFQ